MTLSIKTTQWMLGREDKRNHGQTLTAISIIETDEPVTESVIHQLFENKAVKVVRRASLSAEPVKT